VSKDSSPQGKGPSTARQEFAKPILEVNATAYKEARGEVKSSKGSFSGEVKGQFTDKRRSRGDRKPDCDASSKMSVATAGGLNVTIIDDFATSSAHDTNRSPAIVGVVTAVDATGAPAATHPLQIGKCFTYPHDGSEQIGESINIPINIWNANYDDPSSYGNLQFKSTE